MTTREELEKLKCGDKILVSDKERIFIGLKPFDEKLCPVVYLDIDTIPTASAYEFVEIPKLIKRLYAYKCKDSPIQWFEKLIETSLDVHRAPEWDKELQ